MRYLVLTVDYEIFGNGTGDVRQHIIDPTERMARICQQYDFPLTVFFEAEEYVAFRENAARLRKDLGYDPAALIRQQIVSLLRQGHDVQLHLHPEWYGARYEAGTWLLHPGKKTVDSLFETQAEVTNYIASRKALIDEIVAQASSLQQVRAYRAGAFSAQPGQKLLPALSENGFIIESSVVKGLHNAGQGFDYKSAPSSKGPWRISQDVIREDPTGPLWEFPIYSVMGRRFQQLTFDRLRAKFSRTVPREKQRELIAQLGIRPRNPLSLLKFLWQPVPLKLDYHNISAKKLMRWINNAPKPADRSPDVVTLIGHTKEHIDDRELGKLLRGIARESDFKVISLTALAKSLATKDVNLAVTQA
ncbi:MAG TPA: hypothetical protein VH619_16720 [Verrucomicrobiae bacterium]|jgi:hypothetical protein|nr:hypothetical protein [Verrucomicrobiae bacterium]